MKAGRTRILLGGLEDLPPSTIFAHVADEAAAERRAHLEELVRVVEGARLINLPGFVGHASNSTETTDRAEAQEMVAKMAALISFVEYGPWEHRIERHASDLLVRYRAARDEALSKLKSARAILIAGLQNVDGAERGETVDERLDRTIAAAKEEPPIYVGSFAQHANEPDDE
jgi:hypothetical protein